MKGSAPSTDSSFDGGAESFDEPTDGMDAFDDAAPEEGNSDKPFDDEPFDAGVEADEDTDPAKYIQQLSGKLGQTLRQYTEDNGQPDFDLEKFAINSVLSATHTGEMDDNDQKDIINKVKGSGKDGDSVDGGEENMDADIEEPAADGEEDLDFGDEPVEEIVEELPLNVNSTEMNGMVSGCQVEQPPIDSRAVDILKDMTESENDTMLSNLKNMKTDAEKILSMDKDKLDKKLSGMDWADDHISTSTDDTEEVADYLTTENKNPCWNGYKQVGMKDKDGKQVPNCVPIEENITESEYQGKGENNLKESEKNSTFVDKSKLIKALRLMENVEPMIQPITKPTTEPVRPMRETDRPFLPKRKDKVNPKPKAEVNEIEMPMVEFDGKQVNVNSLRIGGVDRKDYPDFVDAFFSYGEYSDGMKMSDIELQKLTDEQSELINELIFDGQLYM